MCIISVKPQGEQLPSEQIIRTMFNANSHGAGYMIQREGKGNIKISKGYEKIEGFLAAVNKEKVGVDDIFVMHFRIATSGGVNKAMCHPFVAHASPDIANVKEATIKENSDLICFAHNGVIQDLNSHTAKYSDTSLFAQHYLSDPAISNNIYESLPIQEMVERFIDKSRLSLLHPTKGLLLLGKWEESDGIHYSNSSYKVKTFDSWDYQGYGGWGKPIGYNPMGNTAKTEAEKINELAKKYEKASLSDDKSDADAEVSVPAEVWSMKQTRSELQRIYQKVLRDNPPKDALKKDLITALDEYRADCIVLVEKAKDSVDDIPCECEMCTSVLPESQMKDIDYGNKTYSVCDGCFTWMQREYDSDFDTEGDIF